MNEWKRQHSAAIFIGFLNNIKEMIFTAIAVLIFGQSTQAFGTLYYTIIFGIILFFSLWTGIVKWWTFKYQLQENELKIKQGLIFRKNRFIRKERIQSIDINEKILQRLFKLVELRIETAGGGAEPEFRIVALNKEEAVIIKRELLSKDTISVRDDAEEGNVTEEVAELEGQQPQEMEQEPFKWKLSNKRLFVAAVTSSGIGIAATFVAAIISQIQQFIPEALYEQFIGWILHSSIVFIGFWIVIIFVIGWLITLVKTVLKYGQFSVEKNKDEINISRGILEKRHLTLSQRRITTVRIVQNILRQPFGYVSIYVESAGGGSKEEDLSTILIPICKRKEVNTLLEEILPEYVVEGVYESLPKKSLRRYMIKLIIPAVIISGMATYFFTFGWLAFILPIIAALYGYWQYIDAGIDNSKDRLLLKYRTISRYELIIPRKRIQAMTSSQTLLQRTNQLYTIHVSILTSITGKTFNLRHISEAQRLEQFRWFSYEEEEKSEDFIIKNE